MCARKGVLSLGLEQDAEETLALRYSPSNVETEHTASSVSV